MNRIFALHVRPGMINFASCLMQNNNVKQLNFVCLNVNYEVRFNNNNLILILRALREMIKRAIYIISIYNNLVKGI